MFSGVVGEFVAEDDGDGEVVWGAFDEAAVEVDGVSGCGSVEGFVFFEDDGEVANGCRGEGDLEFLGVAQDCELEGISIFYELGDFLRKGLIGVRVITTGILDGVLIFGGEDLIFDLEGCVGHPDCAYDWVIGI